MLNHIQPQTFPYREHRVCYISLRAHATKKIVYLTIKHFIFQLAHSI